MKYACVKYAHQSVHSLCNTAVDRVGGM